jgi:AcrR family transcriptional regulator
MPGSDLKPRSIPQQARSRATVEHVLRVSAELLEELGLEGFNTNLLAERAGVNLRAIYRYFPNKKAILLEMAVRMREIEHAWVGDLSQVADRAQWRSAVDRAIDGYFQAASRRPGYAALRAAAQAMPELKAVDHAENISLQDDLAAGLTKVGLSLDPAHLSALCETIIESASRILDIAIQSPPSRAELLVRELKRMIVNLLADYLDNPSGDASMHSTAPVGTPLAFGSR